MGTGRGASDAGGCLHDQAPLLITHPRTMRPCASGRHGSDYASHSVCDRCGPPAGHAIAHSAGRSSEPALPSPTRCRLPRDGSSRVASRLMGWLGHVSRLSSLQRAHRGDTSCFWAAASHQPTRKGRGPPWGHHVEGGSWRAPPLRPPAPGAIRHRWNPSPAARTHLQPLSRRAFCGPIRYPARRPPLGVRSSAAPDSGGGPPSQSSRARRVRLLVCGGR